MKNKKAGFEMSITTIVVLVIAVIMLILGLFLVRNIMCGAIGMTGDLNEKIRGQINDLFTEAGGEVQCIGAGAAIAKLPIGDIVNIYCSFRPKKDTTYNYTFTIGQGEISKDVVKGWIVAGQTGIIDVAAGDYEPKKLMYMRIPEGAFEGLVVMNLKVQKKEAGQTRWSSTRGSSRLAYNVVRLGGFQRAMC